MPRLASGGLVDARDTSGHVERLYLLGKHVGLFEAAELEQLLSTS